jgi:HK97 family phage prohead protease
MYIRTKNGCSLIDSTAALLAFLGVRSEEGGFKPKVQWKVEGDVEVIASVPFVLSAEQEDQANIPWTFSTFDLDRFDERVDPAGWDFKQFLKNPVICWAHRYDIPAIGKADNVYADEKGRDGSIVFNSKDIDPFGWAIGERVKAGVIRAGSVGFRVLEIELPAKEEAKDGTALIFRKQELLEFSVCNVPANPFALAHSALTKSVPEMKQTGFPNFWGNIINNYQE